MKIVYWQQLKEDCLLAAVERSLFRQFRLLVAFACQVFENMGQCVGCMLLVIRRIRHLRTLNYSCWLHFNYSNKA